MDELRRPFLIVALVSMFLAFGVCLGSRFFLAPPPGGARVASAVEAAGNDPAMVSELAASGVSLEEAESQLAERTTEDPPGLAISDLGVINGLLVLVLTLTTLPWLVGDRVTGSVQGVFSIIGGLIGLVASVLLAIVAIAALMLMVSMLLSVPFGTLAYLATFGSFDTGAAGVAVGLLVVLQAVSAASLVLAHQSFLTNKGLVLIYATAIISTLVVSLLHRLVPGFLVSITDAIAAIIVCVLAAVWSLVVLVGGIVSITRLH